MWSETGTIWVPQFACFMLFLRYSKKNKNPPSSSMDSWENAMGTSASIPLGFGGKDVCFLRILLEGENDRLLFSALSVGVDGHCWWQDPANLLDFPRKRASAAEQNNASNGYLCVQELKWDLFPCGVSCGVFLKAFVGSGKHRMVTLLYIEGPATYIRSSMTMIIMMALSVVISIVALVVGLAVALAVAVVITSSSSCRSSI